MKVDGILIAGSGLSGGIAKSRLPAWMDLLQGVTGLLLALFMWMHMLFVSSILLGEDAMYVVTKAFEGYYFFGESYPGLVAAAVAAVIVLFVLHAGLAMRKFPTNYLQWRTLLAHKAMIRHTDTGLWFVQVYTGFAMFFLGSAHLFFMLTHPGDIGPYASADRVWGGYWPIYLLLLLAVEFHGGIGLYRLAIKWGWFSGGDPESVRRRLKTAKLVIAHGFLVLGLLTLAAYMKIGYEHRAHVGERYQPPLSAMVVAPRGPGA